LTQLADAVNQSPKVQQLRAMAEMTNSLAPVVQTKSTEEEEKSPAQRKPLDEEKLTQTKSKLDEEKTLQGRFEGSPAAVQRKEADVPSPNRTGLPDGLKSGIESLSGISLDGVKVHYNSSQPAQLNALAYAQGSEIHVAPGQEKHLPHEAWHVVQQAQGRVQPTMQMKAGVPVNDDKGLEHEADVMGARAAQLKKIPDPSGSPKGARATSDSNVVQRMVGFEFETKWDLRRPALMAWNPDTPLVRGTNWQMSPDEIAGRDAKIEFKTDAFDVDAPNAQATVDSIEATFASLTKYIQARLLPLNQGQFSPLATQLPAANGVQVQPSGPLTAKPQATGGVRSDLVFSFLKDLASAHQPRDLMPGAQKKEKLGSVLNRVSGEMDERSQTSREYWGVVALLANLILRFQADKDKALEEYREWRTQTQKDLDEQYQAWVLKYSPGEEAQETKKTQVREHFTQLSLEKREEIRKERAPSYAKARASALPRVAFNELPQVAIGNLLRDVLQAAGLQSPADGALRMFPLGMKRNAVFQQTIAQWIASIQQQIPMGQEGELWSKRSLGTGPVGKGTTRGTGIPFELRGIPGPVPHDEGLEFALPFIAYFEELNRRKR
jgi:hypothetical protein